MTKAETYYRQQQRLYLDKFQITQKVVAVRAGCSDRTVRSYLDGTSDNPHVNNAIKELVKAARLALIEKLKQEVSEINDNHIEMTGEKIPKKILDNSLKYSSEYKFAQ